MYCCKVSNNPQKIRSAGASVRVGSRYSCNHCERLARTHRRSACGREIDGSYRASAMRASCDTRRSRRLDSTLGESVLWRVRGELHQALHGSNIFLPLLNTKIAPAHRVSIDDLGSLQNMETDHSLLTVAFSSVQPLFFPAAAFLSIHASTLSMVDSRSWPTTSSG
jgi:hypothetical protein